VRFSLAVGLRARHSEILMAFADYAAAHANDQSRNRRGPSPWVTALLTALTPGLGHLYLGQPRRGVTLFILVIIADTLLMFAMMGVLARFWMFAVSLALLVGLWVYIMADAISRAYHMRDFPQQHYNRWPTYAGAFVLACLIFAGPCVYAVHAKTSGRLLWLNAVNPSMEPTLRLGEYFLADASYYRNRHPSRGEVAVYVHPKQEQVHYIKRIVAVEGDRIAIKGGRAVVNGVMVEEPYIEVGDPQSRFANEPEIRVPAGHVYVLGDNRAESVDSRDYVAHGPVPVANLMGRVTDIAISRHLLRMGRWVGTPSNS
jgi:signal peptidase I